MYRQNHIYIYVCMYMCIHIYMYTCIHVHTCVAILAQKPFQSCSALSQVEHHACSQRRRWAQEVKGSDSVRGAGGERPSTHVHKGARGHKGGGSKTVGRSPYYTFPSVMRPSIQFALLYMCD